MVTYGLLRYLNADGDLIGAEPGIGFNYLGRMGSLRCSPRTCRIDPGRRTRRGRGAIAMPLMYTVALNAGTMETGAGPRLQASWTWAPSALDAEQIDRLEQVVVPRSAASAPMCSTVAAG